MTVIDAIGIEDLEAYRGELVGYCYRLLASIQEAEDAVQETMMRAWRALARFEDRGGVRPWLYRIATNVCIDMSNGRVRRALPVDLTSAGSVSDRLVRSRPEATWVQPAPDAMVLHPSDDPADEVVQRESVRLAFLAAMQRLSGRQRAVLILRDVYRWPAAEVARLLDTSPGAVNSVLRRARSALEGCELRSGSTEPTEADLAVLDGYIDAFERQDVAALAALLRDDAIVEMPPYELWLQGRETIQEWLDAVDALSGHIIRPVRANASLAVALHRPQVPGGPPVAHAVHVLDVIDGAISAIRSFIDPGLFPFFGLPLELPFEPGPSTGVDTGRGIGRMAR